MPRDVKRAESTEFTARARERRRVGAHQHRRRQMAFGEGETEQALEVILGGEAGGELVSVCGVGPPLRRDQLRELDRDEGGAERLVLGAELVSSGQGGGVVGEGGWQR